MNTHNHPLDQKRLEAAVVEGVLEESQVWVELQAVGLDALLNGARELLQDGQGDPALDILGS